MFRKLTAFVFVFILLVSAVPALAQGGENGFPGAPNFGGAIWADGHLYGTKGLGDLPAPNDANGQSFDPIFLVPDQAPVAEAAPGNPAYNGGRWSAHSVTWIGEPVLVTSYAQLVSLAEAGQLTYAPLGVYFECPLLETH